MKQFYTFIYEANVNKLYDNIKNKKDKEFENELKKEFKNELTSMSYYEIVDELTRETYDKLVNIDPTQDHKYTRWIVKTFITNLVKHKLDKSHFNETRFFAEDAPIITDNIDSYMRNIKNETIKKDQKERNIDFFKTFAAFHTFLEDKVKPTKTDLDRQIEKDKNDIDIFEETEKYKVVMPKSMNAARYWGKGTTWCTATKTDNNMFEEYYEKGPIYTIVDKENPDKKYQAHFVEYQFTDETNSAIKMNILNELLSNLPKFANLFKKRVLNFIKILNDFNRQINFSIIDDDYYLLSSNDLSFFRYFFEPYNVDFNELSELLSNEYEIIKEYNDYDFNLSQILSDKNKKILYNIYSLIDDDEIDNEIEQLYYNNMIPLYIIKEQLDELQEKVLNIIKSYGYSYNINNTTFSIKIPIEHIYKMMTGELDSIIAETSMITYNIFYDELSLELINKNYVKEIQIEQSILKEKENIKKFDDVKFNIDVANYLEEYRVNEIKKTKDFNET